MIRTKIVILKWIDKLIGKPAVILLSEWQGIRGKGLRGVNIDSRLTTHDSRLKNFLIIRPGGIGDAVLLFPALTELRKSFPHSQIHVLAEKRNAGILELCPSIDRLYLYDRGLDLFRVLRNNYDAAIDTEQWHRLSAVIAFLTGAEVRIGFSTNERERLFTHRVEYSHHDYEANSFIKLFSVLLNPNVEFDPEKPFINIPNSQSAISGHPQKRVVQSSITIALSLEASIKEREWGIEKFSGLADRLIQKGVEIVVIDKKRINDFNVSGIKNLTGKLNLVKAAKELSKVSLLVSGDTGIMHIAYGLGISTVSLFGPGIEDKWAPKGKNHIIINKRLSCSPCTKFGYTPACPRDAECMKMITVDEVEDAVLKLINTFIKIR
ncbi:MAG: glycosyltransferase family 9 protein [Nitrospinae bacterium]|nr:glycosyltransferase family 9 protein [Nitrospinota bacterium]